MAKKRRQQVPIGRQYAGLLSSVSDLLEQARRTSARTVNTILTSTYWEIGRQIVEFEQGGKNRADYGDVILARLSDDLTKRFGRGFGPVNLSQMRKFYRLWPTAKIFQTLSEKSGSKDILEIKDPYVLEFLGLKDECSENDLEEALIQHLERFLLELGGDFAFVGRQKRLRIGNEWYRIDLLFFHRKLRCLVVIDLKVGKFTHADAGQMHLYLNYAREHWVNNGENPPVGLILCAEKDSAVAKYALEGLPNKVLAAEYKLALPDEKKLIRELKETQKKLIAGKKQ